MNQCYYDFVLECTKQLDLKGPMINIGSRIVPGQERFDLNQIPALRDMRGIDMEYGNGVDEIGLAEDIHRDYKSQGVVMCVSALEHIQRLQEACAEMMRVVRDDGFIIVGVPFYFPFHACPCDYWRFTSPGLIELFHPMEHIHIWCCGPRNYYHTIIMVASNAPFTLDLSDWAKKHKNPKPLWRDILWTIRKRWL